MVETASMLQVSAHHDTHSNSGFEKLIYTRLQLDRLELPPLGVGFERKIGRHSPHLRSEPHVTYR